MTAKTRLTRKADLLPTLDRIGLPGTRHQFTRHIPAVTNLFRGRTDDEIVAFILHGVEQMLTHNQPAPTHHKTSQKPTVSNVELMLVHWASTGLSYKTVKRLLTTCCRPADVEEAIWRDAGFSLTQIHTWHPESWGRSPFGLSPATVRAGAHAARLWREAGFDGHSALSWAQAAEAVFTPELARQLLDAGFDLDQATTFYHQVVPPRSLFPHVKFPQTCTIWLRTGLPAEKILEATRAALTPDEAARLPSDQWDSVALLAALGAMHDSAGVRPGTPFSGRGEPHGAARRTARTQQLVLSDPHLVIRRRYKPKQ